MIRRRESSVIPPVLSIASEPAVSPTGHAVAASPAANSTDALQLLQLASFLAPFQFSPAYADLPGSLQYNTVRLLTDALESARAPLASARLVEDTLVLLTFGLSQLGDNQQPGRAPNNSIGATVRSEHQKRLVQRQKLLTKAKAIQTTWRCQRYNTQRQAPLELTMKPTVELDAPPPGTALAPMTMTVELDESDLRAQIDTYTADLAARVKRQKEEAERQRRQAERERREQQERKKRTLLQKKKRYENVCRRWNYFSVKLLRQYNDSNGTGLSRLPRKRSLVVLAEALEATQNGRGSQPSTPTTPPYRHGLALAVHARHLARARARRHTRHMSLMKSAVHRNFIRRFVDRVVHKGVARVLCQSNMMIADEKVAAMAHRGMTSVVADDDDDKVCRIGILLCDLHFGLKYAGLYQRFFERVAKDRGLRIEWRLFNCVRGQFPSRATQARLDGFLVGGGPSSGVGVHQSLTNESDQSSPTTTIPVGRTKRFGRWRDRVKTFLRYMWLERKKMIGALGLGHVVLAEALGAERAMHEWEDGWNVLDPRIFGDDARIREVCAMPTGRRLSMAPAGRQLGIKYLHGEFVSTMEHLKTAKVWYSADRSYVSCFRDRLALSVDGFPECGSFVFETLSEVYDREKRAQNGMDDEGEDEEGDLEEEEIGIGDNNSAVTPSNPERRMSRRQSSPNRRKSSVRRASSTSIHTETVLTPEDKRRLLDVRDVGDAIARLLLDHFCLQAGYGSSASASSGPCVIAAMLGASNIHDLDESIHVLAAKDGLQYICVRVHTTADGHLVVLNAHLAAMVSDRERRIKEHKRHMAALTGGAPQHEKKHNSGLENSGLPLHDLREHKLLRDDGDSQLSPRESHSLQELPKLRPQQSAKQLMQAGSSRELVQRRRTAVDTPPSASTSIGTVGSPTAAPHPGRAGGPPKPGTGVLTLSEVLSAFQSEFSQKEKREKILRPRPKFLFQFAEEENSTTSKPQIRTQLQLRRLWVRLVAALRVAEVSEDSVAVVSRQLGVLAYMRRKRPLWTFFKDCRHSNAVPHRQRLKLMVRYAIHADAVLYDQDLLLSNLAKENEALFQQAHRVGLQLFVGRKENINPYADIVGELGLDRLAMKKTLQLRQPRRGMAIARELGKHRATERDMQVLELMLLQLTGIAGVVSWQPDVALDAVNKVNVQDALVQEVEQLFRRWQAKDSTSSPKRQHGSARATTPEGLATDDGDEVEDVVTADQDDCDSDSAVEDKDVVLEMTRQFAQHSTRQERMAGAFVPLRPLQPKRGDQVLGMRPAAPATAIGPEEQRTRLKSIGSFRMASLRHAVIAKQAELEERLQPKVQMARLPETPSTPPIQLALTAQRSFITRLRNQRSFVKRKGDSKSLMPC